MKTTIERTGNGFAVYLLSHHDPRSGAILADCKGIFESFPAAQTEAARVAKLTRTSVEDRTKLFISPI